MIPIRVFLPVLIICLVFPVSNSEEDKDVRQSLVQFMDMLKGGQQAQLDPNWGWNATSDPCAANWTGVSCDSNFHVRTIVLNDYNFSGTFDDTSVCSAKSLNVLSLNRNSISGSLTQGIGNCKELTHLYLGRNKLSGEIPDSLYQLTRLKRLDLSDNGFSGQVFRIIGLLTFFVQDNQLSGPIPDFDFSLLEYFNVSNNNFSGPIPDTKGKFKDDSYLDDPGLCGEQVSNACPPSNPPPKADSGYSSKNGVLIYSGYFILGLILLLLIVLRVMSKKKPKEGKTDAKKESSVETSTKPSSTTSDEFIRTSKNRSEYSISSVEVGGVSQSLVALGSPLGKNLRFEDLLRAPAELLGKGKSLYKVLHNNGEILTVKRIKDWGISNEDFKRRMERIDQVKHPRLLPALAYYCSKQEKLLVYEYQENGSLFKLLHGSQNGQAFDWENRLTVAAMIADTLKFLHQEFLEDDGIAHGNLKSTNILFNKKMDPCISEYGLNTVVENQDKPFISQTDHGSKLDVYGYGIILLELLTGKLVQNSGIDLGKWVRSVVTEEWTAEVFDRALLSEGASEERMVNLLQVALKCINPNPNQRPTISQVAGMINSIKEEDERSIMSEPSFADSSLIHA